MKSKIKIIGICLIISAVLALVTVQATNTYYEKKVRSKYVELLVFMLNKTQQELYDTMESGERALLGDIAIEYASMGGNLQMTCYAALDMYHPDGEWGSLANILEKIGKKKGCFKEWELQFLEQVYSINGELLRDLKSRKNIYILYKDDLEKLLVSFMLDVEKLSAENREKLESLE